MLFIKKHSSFLFACFLFLSCKQGETESRLQQSIPAATWKTAFDQQLPLLGHRNWIIIADKAFPQQNAAGMETINTGENLLPVLKYVLQQVNASAHVKPIIYRDKELNFITEELAGGAGRFIKESGLLFNGQPVQTILHDSVFTQLSQASKLFKILVLKTNETIPYSSVFLQLDCAYWNAAKEASLRRSMTK